MKKNQPFDHDLSAPFKRWMRNEQEPAEESEFASDKSFFTGELVIDFEDFLKMWAMMEKADKRFEYLHEAEENGTLTSEEQLELQGIYDSWSD